MGSEPLPQQSSEPSSPEPDSWGLFSKSKRQGLTVIPHAWSCDVPAVTDPLPGRTKISLRKKHAHKHSWAPGARITFSSSLEGQLAIYSRAFKKQILCEVTILLLGVPKLLEFRTWWINNKVLLYNTENYVKYPMINHNGKEYKKGV